MRESNLQRRWVREEVVILVTEYFRTKNLSTKEVNESYYQISEFLRKREEILTGHKASDIFRDFAGIRMQSGRIRSGNAIFGNERNEVTKSSSTRIFRQSAGVN
mgnify:CR=1 FL=1